MPSNPKTVASELKRDARGQLQPRIDTGEAPEELSEQSAGANQSEARKLASQVLKRLWTIARSPKSAASAKVAACNAILDRAYGKPAQALELGNKDGEVFRTAQTERMGRMTDEQLETEIDRIEERMAAVPIPPGDIMIGTTGKPGGDETH